MVVQKPENVLRVCPFLHSLYSNLFLLTVCLARRRYTRLSLFIAFFLVGLCMDLLLELIAVGQNMAALQSLHEIITSKRSKSASLQSLEPIMLRFVELCDRTPLLAYRGVRSQRSS